MDKKEDKINMLPNNSFFDFFGGHLEINNNNRILFSGKFGIGKTYFLKKFFEEKSEKYEVFHLYPVNYQISSNKDVFDLLKYDILIELLNSKNKDIFKVNNNDDVGMVEYIKKDFNTNNFLKKTVATAIEPLPGIGKVLGKPLSEMLDFDKRFQEFKKGDEGIIKSFLEKIKNSNPTEIDYLSQILKNKIEELKGQKESILILDDLDRLDPEHIFRLLNVFSAFFEQNENNKFGFDKIILVADYDNLKSIFSHKYGENTCERGYFNKFYSIEVFDFDNSKIIKSYLNHFFKEIKTNNIALKESMGGENFHIKTFLEDVLFRLLEIKKLDLRQLMTINEFELPAFKKYYLDKQTISNDIWNTIKISIEILNSIYGDKESFLDSIESIRDNLSSTNNDLRNRNSSSIYLTFATHLLRNLEKDEDSDYIIKNKNADIKFKDFVINDPCTKDGNKSDLISLVTNFNAREVSLFYTLLFVYLEKESVKRIALNNNSPKWG